MVKQIFSSLLISLIYLIKNNILLANSIYITILGDFYDGGDIKQCPPPCNTIDFTFGYPSIYKTKNNATSRITLYFDTSVSVRESRLAYPGSSLFAEIGGYSGLLLGFSLFDFARFFEFISERIQKLGETSSQTNA